MSYTVRLTNGSTLATVADLSIDTTSTSLSLVGRGAVNYGEAFAENFVHLLENFANATAPSPAIAGQLWYDTTVESIKVYDGVNWRLVSGSGAFTSGTNIASGTTIGGGVATGFRGAGAFGSVLTQGINGTTVSLLVSEGRIIAIASPEFIASGSLPVSITVEGQILAVQSRFPNGLRAGVTLATDPAGYTLSVPSQPTQGDHAVNLDYLDTRVPTLASEEGYLRNNGMGMTHWVATSWTTGTRPSSPFVGQVGFNTDNGAPETWNGAAWVTVGGARFFTSATSPTNPILGDIWYRTTNDTLYVRSSDGATDFWLDVSTSGSGGGGSNFTASPTPPPSPTAGDFWFDTDDMTIYLYVTDGSSNVWVDVSG